MNYIINNRAHLGSECDDKIKYPPTELLVRKQGSDLIRLDALSFTLADGTSMDCIPGNGEGIEYNLKDTFTDAKAWECESSGINTPQSEIMVSLKMSFRH